MPTIISADEIKTDLPNYNPSKAELFHGTSAKIADKQFQRTIKEDQSDKVILLSGGSASGKTEFMVTQLKDETCIILDTTLPTETGAKIKIRSVQKLNKQVVIYAVIPDNLTRAFIAFLNRDRKFKDDHFYRTHSGSRRTLLWIANNYPDVEIVIIESSYTSRRVLQFDKIPFPSKEELLQYLKSIQMSEADIIGAITL